MIVRVLGDLQAELLQAQSALKNKLGVVSGEFAADVNALLELALAATRAEDARVQVVDLRHAEAKQRAEVVEALAGHQAPRRALVAARCHGGGREAPGHRLSHHRAWTPAGASGTLEQTVSDDDQTEAPPHAGQAGKKAPKARSKYTRQLYDTLLAAYREAPGNHQAAARYASLDRAACRKAWNEGWKKYTWARPLKDVIAEEAREAAARKREVDKREREAADAEREAARREHLEELTEEGRIRAALRKDLLGAALVLSELIPATRALAGVVKSSVLEADGKTLKAKPEVTAMQAMKLLKEYGMTVGRVASAGELIVQLGRTVRGQANAVVGLVDMSHEEALEELEMAAEVREQIREARGEAGAQGGEEDGEPPEGPVH